MTSKIETLKKKTLTFKRLLVKVAAGIVKTVFKPLVAQVEEAVKKVDKI